MQANMTRNAIAAGLLASLMASPASAQISDNVVRISILNDMTGIYARRGRKGLDRRSRARSGRLWRQGCRRAHRNRRG